MRARTICALGFVLAAVGVAAGCVGDDPVSSTSPPAGNDASTESDGGPGPGPGTDGGIQDSSTPSDTGVDSGPPACTKIQVTTIAGSASAGNTNGPGATATFNGPEGITVDPSNGTLYVADTGNKLVRRVLANGTTSTLAANAGTSGAWQEPRHATFLDASLYISDPGHSQTYLIDLNSGAATSVAGFASMRSFARQPGTFTIYVVGQARVGRWPGGSATDSIPISGDFTTGFMDGAGNVARYVNLVDMEFDSASDLYVADEGNHRMRKVTIAADATNGSVVTVAGSSTPGHVDGTGGAAQFTGPYAFYFDAPAKTFYIADGATIRTMTTSGVVSTLLGSTSAFADGDGCSAKFVNAKSITKFANELYVTDVNRIRKIVMN